MSSLNVIGLNHSSAPLEARERIKKQFQDDALSYSSLKILPGIQGALILATCNRIEIYYSSDHPEFAASKIKRLLLDSNTAKQRDLSLYSLHDRNAVRHAFAVASGLDSMIPGEPEILGQMKRAFQTARTHGTLDHSLTRLFEAGFHVAKEVRTQTEISKGALSVASVAIEVARKVFRPLQDKVILILGGGQTGETLIKNLVKSAARQIFLSTRTFERGQNLALQYGIQTLPSHEWPSFFPQCDMVLTATSSPEILIPLSMVTAAMRKRPNRPLCLLDLAVPRNIDPLAHQLELVYAFNVDDFKQIGNRNRGQREKAFQHAWKLIEKKADGFSKPESPELGSRIAELDDFLHQLLNEEAENILQESPLAAETQKAFQSAIYQFERSLFHHMVVKLKAEETREREGGRCPFRFLWDDEAKKNLKTGPVLEHVQGLRFQQLISRIQQRLSDFSFSTAFN